MHYSGDYPQLDSRGMMHYTAQTGRRKNIKGGYKHRALGGLLLAMESTFRGIDSPKKDFAMGQSSRERAERRRQREIEAITAHAAPQQPREQVSVRGYVALLGIPALVFAVCMTMTGYSNFTAGIIGSGAAALWFLIDWWLLSRSLPIYRRALGMLLGLAGLATVAYIGLLDAPIVVSWRLVPNSYPVGTKIAGVSWADNLTAMQTYISNETDNDYSNIDISIRTDLTILGLDAKSPFSSCTVKMDGPIKAAELYGVDENGKNITIPVPMNEPGSMGSVFRIRCDKLVAGREIELTTALAAVSLRNTEPVSPIKTKPAWAKMTVQYEGRGRTRKPPQYYKCFVGC